MCSVSQEHRCCDSYVLLVVQNLIVSYFNEEEKKKVKDENLFFIDSRDSLIKKDEQMNGRVIWRRGRTEKKNFFFFYHRKKENEQGITVFSELEHQSSKHTHRQSQWVNPTIKFSFWQTTKRSLFQMHFYQILNQGIDIVFFRCMYKYIYIERRRRRRWWWSLFWSVLENPAIFSSNRKAPIYLSFFSITTNSIGISIEF